MRSLLAPAFVIVACAGACTSFSGEPADAGAESSSVEPPDELEPSPANPGAKITCGTIECSSGESCCIVSAVFACKSTSCSSTLGCDSDDDCPPLSVCCGTFGNDGALVRTGCTQAIRCKTSTRYRHICTSDADCGGKACAPLPEAPPLKGCP